MEEVKFLERFKQVEFVLNSKYEELKYLKYDAITVQNIWAYCVNKKWRKKDVQTMPIHQLVSDIFRVTASDVVNYLQVVSQKEAQKEIQKTTSQSTYSGFVPLEAEEMEMLLGNNSSNNAYIPNENDNWI